MRDLIRLMGVMVPPAAVTLDIDDTVDVVHGHQQLSPFNAHYDERCFLPIHVYDTATSRPVAVLLRPGETPSGTEIRSHLRRLVRRIRRHWPQTRITIRDDGHYGRPEVMEWCDENGVNFIFGLPGNAVLDRLVDETAEDIRTRRALDQKPCLRGFAETRYRAKSWNKERCACARIEATTKGLDIRFVITSFETGSTILPTRVRKPRDKAKVEVAVLIVERWILARLRHPRFFSPAELNAAIVGRTAAAFGHPVNPHLFRDCAATSIAIDDPQHVRIASQILGHRSATTTERYYNQAQAIEASRRYPDFLVALRQGKMTENPELTES